MPDDFFATGREYVPPKSDFKARLAGGPPLFQHGRHCRCKGRFRVTQICRDESQQVVGSGSQRACSRKRRQVPILNGFERGVVSSCEDRKSTRLNSSHGYISYAVFCLKKKKQTVHSAYSSRASGSHSAI